MIKIDGGSMDTKNLNIEQLRAIFPQVFKEGKIDFELLQNELGEYVESIGKSIALLGKAS